MFTIIKTVSGVWYHLFNNGATKVHLSDFDVIIEAISETYVIEAKNGSNIPSQAISISDIRVIDESVSTTIPIAFSGATGLIELLTSLGYPPYLSNAPSQPPVKVYTKGQTAFFTNITQAWIDANFDNTGLGILEAIGWEKVPELDGKVPIGKTTGGLFDTIGNSYGFAHTVLVAHEHDSAVYSNGKKGVNTVGAGAPINGYVLASGGEALDNTVKTSKVGQDHTGAPSTVETGANKNYQPSLIVLYVRRTTDLWISGGNAVPSLPDVLKIGDRVYQEISGSSYTFEIDDRWKDTLINGTTDLILDDDLDLFPVHSVIPFHVYDVDAVLNYTAGTYLLYLGASANADIPIEVGDDCRLKKIGSGSIWELVISNKSTGGASSQNLNQVLTEGNTSDKTIVLNNGTNETIIEPGATSIQNISTTAGVSLTETGVGIYTQDETLGVEIHTDNITETYIAQFPDKIGGSDEIIAMQSDLDFTRRLITKGTGSVTGTVSETILTTLTIPANTLDSSCFIWTTMDFFKTNAGAVTARLYVNNANTLTGATLLGYSTLGSNRNVSFNRKFLVTGTSLDLLTANTAAVQVTNEFIEALYGASTVLTINPSADIFLIYTTQNDATGTVATNKMATVQKMKL